ncbi:peptidase M28-like protein [Pseudoduganella lurida]|uniref:Peptidase M28-like protein n=1 Tax=Pseudoduganella lurida TaxID=1036180 RepID=A0A562RF87_9BURK|nr:M28 family peptidase [Pseudoduganella lurida]TWI67729.1 peptidase M28-like protein [Pseudoduganella lurida]
MRHFVPAIVLALAAATAAAQVPADPLAASITSRISADSLRGHLSFLASDLLEGRGTPSRGQDLAAEYIAAQFRRAGLEPAGDDGYFQTANWQHAAREAQDFTLSVQNGGRTVAVPLAGATAEFLQAVKLPATAAVFMPWKEALDGKRNVGGKVLVVPAEAVRRAARVLQKELKGRPALVIMVDKERRHGGNPGWLIDPEGEAAPAGALPVVALHDQEAAALLEKGGATVTASIAAATVRPVKLRNVIGVLRGADPKLKNTYVMLTAHYDHLGVKNGEIHNGANDDGSGTVSVIEIAAALAAEKQRPRRSVVFMAVFGEELGLLGSRYYGRHPVFPVKDTVADLNLEQVGRTDDSEGAQVSSATLTGYDYSTVTDTLRQAGARTGVKLWKHEKNSDRFFARSDNQALADLGVPAHTLAVSFEFPDYHGKDDDWGKIDYDNMARVNRMVALGLYGIANDPVAPKWTDVPNAKPYVEAAKKLQAK